MNDVIICDQKYYGGLFENAGFYLRDDDIPMFLPGFELLKKSIVIRKICGPINEEFLLMMLKTMGTLVPLKKDKEENEDDAVAWMIEALIIADIIDENEEDKKSFLYSYIREIAGKI